MLRTAVIADDHCGFRATARLLLEDAGFEVIGEVADGAGALSTVAALRPSLLLLDVQLPDTDGFSVAAGLAKTTPGTVVVLTSVRRAAEFGDRLANSPAAFIPKVELSGDALVTIVKGGE
ncbi:MAG: response regulator transcription factor [Nocardioidaceae bacterium]|jgi:DNA-binding NarL/FixJ family response regulator|nr:response regulator transcription factor [Nocardioidaceae bacterium]MDQ3431152.1 response regulator transcription factor [Actinomycetota bacterium]